MRSANPFVTLSPRFLSVASAATGRPALTTGLTLNIEYGSPATGVHPGRHCQTTLQTLEADPRRRRPAARRPNKNRSAMTRRRKRRSPRTGRTFRPATGCRCRALPRVNAGSRSSPTCLSAAVACWPPPGKPVTTPTPIPIAASRRWSCRAGPMCSRAFSSSSALGRIRSSGCGWSMKAISRGISGRRGEPGSCTGSGSELRPARWPAAARRGGRPAPPVAWSRVSALASAPSLTSHWAVAFP